MPTGRAAQTSVKPGKIFRLTVDERSLEQMIVAGGYTYTHGAITPKRFPIMSDQVGEWEARYFYFHFDEEIESGDAKTRIEATDPVNPWQCGAIGHLLAHGAKYPEEQRKFPIIALGSVVKAYGSRHVPYLDGFGAYRSLYLHRWGAGIIITIDSSPSARSLSL